MDSNWIKTKTQSLLHDRLYKSTYDRALFSLLGVVAREIRMVGRQFFTWRHPIFGLYRLIAVSGSVIGRLLLGRSVKFSFAYRGEDRMIEHLLKPLITQNGYYVEVGCNHPVFLSNTYGLYRKGWRGVCIDANNKLIHKFQYYRPKDKAICALVSDKAAETDFYMVQNNVLSTIDLQVAQNYEKEGLQVERTKMVTKTLTSILDKENAPFDIDLLSIDAEDHDYQVLLSLDLEKYSPKLIVVEDDTLDMMKLKENKYVFYLHKKGYALKASALDNLYFMKE